MQFVRHNRVCCEITRSLDIFRRLIIAFGINIVRKRTQTVLVHSHTTRIVPNVALKHADRPANGSFTNCIPNTQSIRNADGWTDTDCSTATCGSRCDIFACEHCHKVDHPHPLSPAGPRISVNTSRPAPHCPSVTMRTRCTSQGTSATTSYGAQYLLHRKPYICSATDIHRSCAQPWRRL